MYVYYTRQNILLKKINFFCTSSRWLNGKYERQCIFATRFEKFRLIPPALSLAKSLPEIFALQDCDKIYSAVFESI